MESSRKKFKTVDEYLSSLPAKQRSLLKAIRKTIQKAAPGAEQSISYNIPAFKLKGALMYYAAFKAHVSIYPRTRSMEKAFKIELAKYEGSKGTIRFPLDKPLPLGLIGRIVKFRVQENLNRKS